MCLRCSLGPSYFHVNETGAFKRERNGDFVQCSIISTMYACRATSVAAGSGLGDMKVHKSRLQRDKEAWDKAVCSFQMFPTSAFFVSHFKCFTLCWQVTLHISVQ